MIHTKFRRGLPTAMISLLLVSLLAACSGGAGSQPDSKAVSQEGKVKLQWMTWGNTEGPDKAIEALFAAYPDMQNKVEFEVVLGGQGDGNVAEKLRLALAANEKVPDILQFNRLQIPEFASAGVLADVSEIYKDNADNIYPSIVDLISYEGKQVAFPTEAKTKIWFYRKDIFDQAGIDPRQVKNLDDFIAAGKKLREQFPNSYIWNMPKNFGGYYTGMVLSGNGGKFWDAGQKKYVVDTDPGVRKAFEAFKKIKDANITVEIADFTPDWEKGFADSTIVSTPLSNWFKNFLPKYAPDQAGKWAAAEWPIVGDADGGSENGAAMFVVMDKSPHKDVAIDLLSKLALTKEGRLAWYKTRSIFPPIKDAANDPLIQQPHPYFGETLPKVEAQTLEKVKVFPYTPSSSLEFTIVNGYLAKYISGELALDDALKRAQKDLETQIGNPFK